MLAAVGFLLAGGFALGVIEGLLRPLRIRALWVTILSDVLLAAAFALLLLAALWFFLDGAFPIAAPCAELLGGLTGAYITRRLLRLGKRLGKRKTVAKRT